MIDAHVHLFPDAASGRAWQESAGFEPRAVATVDAYERRMARAGVDAAIVLLFARAGRGYRRARDAAGGAAVDEDLRQHARDRIRVLNRWGCDLGARDERFLPFVGVDPAFMDADALVAEIRASASAGARGVKLVPPDMERYPDDASLEPVYRTCVELGLPILSQSGAGGSAGAGPRGPFGRPSGWHAVLERHPTLRLVLAHLGRGYRDELVDLARAHAGVHADLSLALGHPHDAEPPDLASVREAVQRIGIDRVLFGTNYPICDPVEYRSTLEALGLTRGELTAIGEENARRLIGA